jgi:hypothetical protein
MKPKTSRPKKSLPKQPPKAKKELDTVELKQVVGGDSADSNDPRGTWFDP